MSTYQGTCGACDASGTCCPAPVLPSYESHLSTAQLRDLKSAAIVYTEAVTVKRAGGVPRFTSHADYIKYRRAQTLAGGASRLPPCRAPQSAIITQLEAVGCATAACEAVCPVSTIPPIDSTTNTPIIFPGDLSGSDIGIPVSAIESFLSEIYETPITITQPIGYPYESFIFMLFPPYCNATNFTPILTVDGSPQTFQSTQFGPSSYVNFLYGEQGIGGVFIIFPNFDLSTVSGQVSVSLTASNSCSSSTGEAGFFCFLAGTPVALADGTSKPIEQVVVGDRVIGAFGEINTVTGTLSNKLGFVPIININGEHKTTAPHPHIAADHTFQCADTLSLTKFAYGKAFPITGAEGVKERRVIKGVNPSRIKKLEVGAVLQTLTGPRTVNTLETIRMPATTLVYHLTTDGSHSYTVDGYAVAGGATEDDFDYDAWVPRV